MEESLKIDGLKPEPRLNTDESVQHSWIWGAVFLLTLVSLALKLNGAFDHSLSGDELFERAGARDSSWRDLLTWSHAMSFFDTPPLSFMIYRLAVIVPGFDSELAWRLPGIVAAALCVPLVFVTARRIFATGPALFAAGLCAVDLNLGWNSQIARPYPFLAFFLLGALALDKTEYRPGRVVMMLLAFTAAMWTHLFAFIFVGGMAATGWLCWLVRKRQGRIPALPPLLLSATLALLANAAFFLIYRLVGDLRQSSQISGVPHSWGEAINRIRWCMGLITWIPLPFLNPTVWVLAFFGLAWRGWRHYTSASMILGGGLAVVLSLLYAVWRHEFLEPRYLLGAAMMLWFGMAAVGQFLLQTKVSNTFLVFCGITVLIFQGWRSVHNEQYYGTISNDRAVTRRLEIAVAYIRSHFPEKSVFILPDIFVLRESLIRAGLKVAPESFSAQKSQAGSSLYLLAGATAVSRRHGNPVSAFVQGRLSSLNRDRLETETLLRRCEAELWTVWVDGPAGPTILNF